MAWKVFISVVLICLLVMALSGLVSTAYVITGLMNYVSEVVEAHYSIRVVQAEYLVLSQSVFRDDDA